MTAALTAASCAVLALSASAQRVVEHPGPSKLTTVLADLVRAVPQTAAAGQRVTAASTFSADAMPRSVQDALRGGWLRIDANDAAQVYILLNDVSDGAIRELTAAGATIEVRSDAARRVQARVPVSRLQAVARVPAVDEIRLPVYARHRSGNTTTEGDAILGADALRQQYGLDGTDVRVGVISDGLKGVFAGDCTACSGVDGGPMSTGDLPSATGVRNASGVLTSVTGAIVGKSLQANGDLEGLPASSCAFAGAGAEGTALLEIVHDLAPGAKLSFANGETDLEFQQAVNFLAASNDVVVDDIGFYGIPYDGTSAVSQNTAAALNNPANPVRGYFTAVGNDADEHYYGAYVDSGVDGSTIGGIGNPGHLHLFQRTADTTDVMGLGAQPYNVISLPQNGEVAIFLNWDDPFGGSSNNYDLYLVQQGTGQVVASSTDVQNGSQDPGEFIDYVNKGGQDFFRIVVQNVRNAAQPKHLNLFSFQPECASAGPLLLAPPHRERHNFNTASHSVAAQGDAAGSPVGVISVGAICSASASAAATFPSSAPDASCRDTSHETAEFFSSVGPTIDGRTKPDIAAIDGVSVSGAGSFPTPFFGTSAAAPHVAGIAALLLQGASCLLNRSSSTTDPTAARSRLRDLLLDSAAPLGGDGPNNVFGAGRIDALAAVRRTLPVFKGPHTTVTIDGNSELGATLTGAQLGFVDPDQCPLTALNWTGGSCGTGPGETMTCPFGTSTVSVSATNNNFAYSASTDLTITVTDFSFGVSPGGATVTAGQSSSYLVSVAPQHGPFNSDITLGCSNLPAQTACTFDPPALRPGTSQAQSRLTITTARAAAAGPSGRLRGAPIRLRLASTRSGGWLWAALFAALLTLAWRRRPLGSGPAIAWMAAISVAAVALFGVTAIADQGLALFPGGLTFGSQTVGTASPPQTVYLTNVGTDALAVGGITAAGDFTQVNTCGASLAPGVTCAISVSFTPTAAGARTGSVAIVDGAAGSPHVVDLSGTGQAVPDSTTGTPAGSYAIAVSGTAGTLVRFGTVTLTVQ